MLVQISHTLRIFKSRRHSLRLFARKNRHSCDINDPQKNDQKGEMPMLTLKHLFQNNDLAEMILKNWSYDPESLDMFQYYRISSNAVYPFRDQGKSDCFDLPR